MAFDLVKFGNQLRTIRKSYGYTQNDVYSLSGVSCEIQRLIEKGERLVRIDILNRLSYLYKIDLLILLSKSRSDLDVLSDGIVNTSLEAYFSNDFSRYRRMIHSILTNLANEFSAIENSQLYSNYIDILKETDFLSSNGSWPSSVKSQNLLVSLSIKNDSILNDPYFSNLETSIAMILAVSLRKEGRFKESLEISERISEYFGNKMNLTVDECRYEAAAVVNYCYANHMMGNHEVVIRRITKFLKDPDKIVPNSLHSDLLFRLATSLHLTDRKEEANNIYTIALSFISEDRKSIFKDIVKNKYDLSIIEFDFE